MAMEPVNTSWSGISLQDATARACCVRSVSRERTHGKVFFYDAREVHCRLRVPFQSRYFDVAQAARQTNGATNLVEVAREKAPKNQKNQKIKFLKGEGVGDLPLFQNYLRPWHYSIDFATHPKYQA